VQARNSIRCARDNLFAIIEDASKIQKHTANHRSRMDAEKSGVNVFKRPSTINVRSGDFTPGRKGNRLSEQMQKANGGAG
jgi:hypothetical protein